MSRIWQVPVRKPSNNVRQLFLMLKRPSERKSAAHKGSVFVPFVIENCGLWWCGKSDVRDDALSMAHVPTPKVARVVAKSVTLGRPGVREQDARAFQTTCSQDKLPPPDGDPLQCGRAAFKPIHPVIAGTADNLGAR